MYTTLFLFTCPLYSTMFFPNVSIAEIIKRYINERYMSKEVGNCTLKRLICSKSRLDTFFMYNKNGRLGDRTKSGIEGSPENTLTN